MIEPKSKAAYTAVPMGEKKLLVKDDVEQPNESKRPSLNKALIAVSSILFLLLLVGIIDDDSYEHGTHMRRSDYQEATDFEHWWNNDQEEDQDWMDTHHRHHHAPTPHHHDHQHHCWWSKVKEWWHRHYHDRSFFPTKLPDGGRDWLVNVVDGTVAAKHDPHLFLGLGDTSSLVLVDKESPNALLFGKVPSSDKDVVDLTTVDDQNIGLQYPQPKAIDPELFYIETGISDSLDPAQVSFVQDNFILLKNTNNKSLVLDVAWWDIVAGSQVNFVGTQYAKSTFVKGGGRDWVWNANGSISPKLNPSLILGVGGRPLILTNNKDSNQVIHLNRAAELANGVAVPMETKDEKQIGFVAQQGQFGPWRYREVGTISIDSDDKPVMIHYDGNYILTNQDDMALDVSFWKMEDGNTVNFVGGDNDKDGEYSDSSSSSDSSDDEHHWWHFDHSSSSISSDSTSSSDSDSGDEPVAI